MRVLVHHCLDLGEQVILGLIAILDRVVVVVDDLRVVVLSRVAAVVVCSDSVA